MSLQLDSGKNYFIHMTRNFFLSLPIIERFSEYNPIFIFRGSYQDAHQKNFIGFDAPEDISYADFMQQVIHSEKFNELLFELKKYQGNIPIHPWKNDPSLEELFDDKNVSCMGLTTSQAHLLNNKVFQYDFFSKKGIPIPEFIISSKNSISHDYDALVNDKGVFIALPYGESGTGSRIFDNKESLTAFINSIDFNKNTQGIVPTNYDQDSFLQVKALNVSSSPSLDLLVANKNEYFVYGLSSQFLKGLGAKGGSNLIALSDSQKKQCYDLGNTVADLLAKEGFNGYYNLDVNFDDKGNIYFCEINGRYAASSGFRMYVADAARLPNTPTVADLEIMAVREGTFNGFSISKDIPIYFYVNELFADYDGVVNPSFCTPFARDLFTGSSNIALAGVLPGGYPVKKNITRLGTFVSLQKNEHDLHNSLKLQEQIVRSYVREL